VTILGAGLVSAPAIDYLANKCHRTVVVVSANPAELERVQQRFPNVTTRLVDVANNQNEVFLLLLLLLLLLPSLIANATT
jgi:saccharopine dehydrogenase-like NADP-dependent oxidoreductase